MLPTCAAIFSAGAALLVERALGLRNADNLKPQTAPSAAPWVRALYADADGVLWKELDIPALIQSQAFLEVSA